MNCTNPSSILVPILLAALTACSTNTVVERTGLAYPAADKSCHIDFFNGDSSAGSYRDLAKLETDAQRNFFFGGKVDLQDAYPALREKACALGADAVIIDDVIESSAVEGSHLHVWARAIKR